MAEVVNAWAVINGAGFLAVVGLLMRTESRITKLETLVQLLEQRHLLQPAKPGGSC